MGRFSGKKCRLLTMFALTCSFFFVELLVGYLTRSVALIADSFHMLSDVIALVIGFLSVQMSPRKWKKNTFGWARAEVLGALVNAVFLMALCFSILVEAVKRMFAVEPIDNPVLILVVGIAGLIVNVIGLFLFHDHGGHSHRNGHHRSLPTIEEVLAEEDINENHENYRLSDNLPSSMRDDDASSGQMNMRGVFLHVLADALGSVIVIISALVIWLTDWEYRYYADPALSIVMVILIMWSTWPLLSESAMILLQTVPTHIQVDSLQRKLLQEIDGVLAVHEFHVWQLAGDRIIASAHIRCRNLIDYMQIAEKVKEFFHNEGIHSTTIQPEFVDMEEEMSNIRAKEEENCILDCPTNTNCVAQTCCGPQNNGKDSPRTPHMTPDCRQRTNGNSSSSEERGRDEVSVPVDMNDSSSSSPPKTTHQA